METRLKIVEYAEHHLYPDGVIFIKENTIAERPVAVIPFPLGKHPVGTKKQREYAKLLSSAPELLELLKRFIEVSASFNDEQFGKKYPDAVLAYGDAKKLIESLTI